jgi:hypothetical protein
MWLQLDGIFAATGSLMMGENTNTQPKVSPSPQKTAVSTSSDLASNLASANSNSGKTAASFPGDSQSSYSQNHPLQHALAEDFRKMQTIHKFWISVFTALENGSCTAARLLFEADSDGYGSSSYGHHFGSSSVGPEVGVEEFWKNLIGILREFYSRLHVFLIFTP